MRKKAYYQNAYGDKLDKDYVLNGYKTTFGIFSKEFQERRPKISEKLQASVNRVCTATKSDAMLEKFLHRYHSYSDYFNPEYSRRALQILVAALVLREV